MKKFKKEKNKIPVFSWCPEIEESAMTQIDNLVKLPFAFHHVAIMLDCHCSKFGMPIGGVVALKGVVCPSMVGSDAGCGLCAVKTSLTELDKDTLKKIIGEIRRAIPVGFNKHKEYESYQSRLMPELSDDLKICNQEFNNACLSIGTLGGGNHFIEIQKGSDGHIWIMIHSGSRNLGKQVADHYNKIAKELNEKWHSEVPKEFDLAFLPIDSEEGKAYIREMNYCVEFALANRKLMMERIINIFNKQFNSVIDECDRLEKIYRDGCPKCGYKLLAISQYPKCARCNWEFTDKKVLDELKKRGEKSVEEYKNLVYKGTKRFKTEPMINIAHNYARMENHFGTNVMVHRKGATLATEDTIGIIPGSMGSNSYIVKGKGNPESFNSCSHGAGRCMGRGQAIKSLNLENEIKILEDQGIVHGIRTADDLDEATSSYKNIKDVMENQKDLVEILVELSPLGVIKG